MISVARDATDRLNSFQPTKQSVMGRQLNKIHTSQECRALGALIHTIQSIGGPARTSLFSLQVARSNTPSRPRTHG